jgi:hypothetical protein
MKYLSKAALFLSASLLWVEGALAQTVVTANIPFDFICQQKDMTHGTYEIDVLSAHAIDVRSSDRKNHVISLVESQHTVRGTDKKLVFHRYGEQYRLTEIQAAPGNVAMQLPISKSEKQASFDEVEASEEPHRLSCLEMAFLREM